MLLRGNLFIVEENGDLILLSLKKRSKQWGEWLTSKQTVTQMRLCDVVMIGALIKFCGDQRAGDDFFTEILTVLGLISRTVKSFGYLIFCSERLKVRLPRSAREPSTVALSLRASNR
jgi:hypothetical protein